MTIAVSHIPGKSFTHDFFFNVSDYYMKYWSSDSVAIQTWPKRHHGTQGTTPQDETPNTTPSHCLITTQRQLQMEETPWLSHNQSYVALGCEVTIGFPPFGVVGAL